MPSSGRSYCLAASAIDRGPDAWPAGERRGQAGTFVESLSDQMCDPATAAGGYKSPPVGMASYPVLKLRCWEHEWLQNNVPMSCSLPLFNRPDPLLLQPQSAVRALCVDVRRVGQDLSVPTRRPVQPAESSDPGPPRLWINDWKARTTSRAPATASLKSGPPSVSSRVTASRARTPLVPKADSTRRAPVVC